MQFTCRVLTCLLIYLSLLTPWTLAQEVKPDLEKQLELAGDNRVELERALEQAPAEQRKAFEFLIRNMRRADLQSRSADFLAEDVRLAYESREMFPWKDEIPEEVFLNDVLPFANIDETREAWRSTLREICQPIVKDCQTTEEAAQALNQHFFKTVGVKYSTKRKKANQSPSESMDQGLASCTGLSILLIDACRSVNVPARLVGIPMWKNKKGNHTWVEVWSDGDWHFTGAAEYNADGLDRGWFVKDAALADKSSRKHSIYAASFARTDTTFPMAWSRDQDNTIYAVNVTDRYAKKESPATLAEDEILVRIRIWNRGKKKRIELPITVRVAGDSSDIGSGKSRNDKADMNDLFEVKLKRETDYELRFGEGDQLETRRFTTDSAETQLLEFEVTGAETKPE